MENQTILFPIPIHRLRMEFQGWMKEVLDQSVSESLKSTSGNIIDTEQLMAKLGVTRPTLSKWRKENRIPFIQVGAVVRYDLDKVLEVLESKKRRSR